MLSSSLNKKVLFTASAALVVVWFPAAYGLDNAEKGILSKYGKRDKNMDNRIGKAALFSKNNLYSLVQCAGTCQRDRKCTSFFYNKVTRECQGQEKSLNDDSIAHQSPDTKYYKMPTVRTTPKLVEKFSKLIFHDEAKRIPGISNVETCLKLCEDNAKCLSINFMENRRLCKPFELVHVLAEEMSDSDDALYYRAEKSFCTADEDYIYVPWLKICLKYHQQKVSWNEADLECKAEGAHLISVETNEVKLYLGNFVETVRFDDTTVHIGIKDTKNDWVYVDWKNNPIKEDLWSERFIDSPLKNCIVLNCFFVCEWKVDDCDSSASEFVCAK